MILSMIARLIERDTCQTTSLAIRGYAPIFMTLATGISHALYLSKVSLQCSQIDPERIDLGLNELLREDDPCLVQVVSEEGWAQDSDAAPGSAVQATVGAVTESHDAVTVFSLFTLVGPCFAFENWTCADSGHWIPR